MFLTKKVLYLMQKGVTEKYEQVNLVIFEEYIQLVHVHHR